MSGQKLEPIGGMRILTRRRTRVKTVQPCRCIFTGSCIGKATWLRRPNRMDACGLSAAKCQSFFRRSSGLSPFGVRDLRVSIQDAACVERGL